MITTSMAPVHILFSRSLREREPNLRSVGAKSTAYANLVRDLKQQGVPIDGIGLQGHLIVGSVPNTIQQNIEQFTALGVEVSHTS